MSQIVNWRQSQDSSWVLKTLHILWAAGVTWRLTMVTVVKVTNGNGFCESPTTNFHQWSLKNPTISRRFRVFCDFIQWHFLYYVHKLGILVPGTPKVDIFQLGPYNVYCGINLRNLACCTRPYIAAFLRYIAHFVYFGRVMWRVSIVTVVMVTTGPCLKHNFTDTWIFSYVRNSYPRRVFL